MPQFVAIAFAEVVDRLVCILHGVNIILELGIGESKTGDTVFRAIRYVPLHEL